MQPLKEDTSGRKPGYFNKLRTPFGRKFVGQKTRRFVARINKIKQRALVGNKIQEITKLFINEKRSRTITRKTISGLQSSVRSREGATTI